MNGFRTPLRAVYLFLSELVLLAKDRRSLVVFVERSLCRAVVDRIATRPRTKANQSKDGLRGDTHAHTYGRMTEVA